MVQPTITIEAFISALEVKLKADYTEEQKELIKSFGDGPMFCFADPGTGKTFTAIGGLLTAELFKRIPGKNIYALSFTNLATGELAVRHERACQRLGVSKTVNIATLHALCKQLLKENHMKLGMNKMDVSGELTMEKAYRIVESSLEEEGLSLSPNQIRACVNACKLLNASMTFDEDVVVTKMAFKECNVKFELFTKIRGWLFSYSFLTETISVSDILLYTVILLQRHPEVSQSFKEKCKLMLVDEAQDLTLLQLRVISLLTDNPILIGDMKQQIYGFNGACPEIVQEFHKMYPNCKDLKLTQSFRCRNEIAEWATRIIIPNNIGGEDYKGIGDGGIVQVLNGLYEESGANIKGLAAKLHDDFVLNKNRFTRDYLFLVRNNISIVPIAEELFKQGLPFRVNKYTPAYEVPLIKELCEIIQLCDQPSNLNNILAMKYLIPEFRGYYNLTDHPFYQICKKVGCSIFEINYQFKDPGVGSHAMLLLLEISEMVKKGAPMKDMLNRLWRTFEENWINYIKWRLKDDPDYYVWSVNALMHKNYLQFMQDERKKYDVIQESVRYQRGIRCYTMHASKGLEADVVYIVDADKGAIPNETKLEKMLKKQCDMDAARAIREERSLCYVACTRAKEELYIVHSGEPSPMLLGNNIYARYDDVYGYYTNSANDIKAFENFVDASIGVV